ncbi:MAG: polysaccharide deacetylase family protein [Clostridia bacterium]|nr:polysaccharide deacetylase family protein [Clostridia bacterium]
MSDKLSAQITRFAGDKRAAVSLTFDDGYDMNSARFFNDEMKKNGLYGTINMTWGFVEKHVEEWNAILDEGVFDAANHSFGHCINYGTSENVTTEMLEHDISDAYALLKEHFPTQSFLVYATPFGGMSDESMAIIKRHHVANRLGEPLKYYTEPLTASDIFEIPGFAALNTTTTEELNRITDEAIRIGAYYVEIYHQYAPDEVQANRITVKESVAREHFAYLGTKHGEMWTPSYTQMTKYVLEAENTVLDTERDGDKIRVTLRCSLDPSLYDYPLTVKVALPAGWEVVAAAGARAFSVKEENGTRYAVAEAMPGATVTIHKG